MGATFVCVSLFAHAVTGQTLVLTGALCGGLVTVAKLAVMGAQLRREAQGAVDLDRVATWEAWHAALTIAMAAAIGAVSAALFLQPDLPLQMLATALVFGYCAGIVVRVAVRPRIAVLALTLSAVPPIVASATWLDAAHTILAGIFGVFPPRQLRDGPPRLPDRRTAHPDPARCRGPRPPRSADEAAQSAGPAGIVPRRDRVPVGEAGAALFRSRRLQGGQRQLRSRDRRRVAVRPRPPVAGGRPGRRHRGSPGRRRVRAAAAGSGSGRARRRSRPTARRGDLRAVPSVRAGGARGGEPRLRVRGRVDGRPGRSPEPGRRGGLQREAPRRWRVRHRGVPVRVVAPVSTPRPGRAHRGTPGASRFAGTGEAGGR